MTGALSELRWDTLDTQRDTVEQYLPPRCRPLREPVLLAIVAAMRQLCLGDDPTYYPDDSTEVDTRLADGLDHTLSYHYWELLHSKADDTLEVFTRLVEDGMEAEDAIRAALLLTVPQTA